MGWLNDYLLIVPLKREVSRTKLGDGWISIFRTILFSIRQRRGKSGYSKTHPGLADVKKKLCTFWKGKEISFKLQMRTSIARTITNNVFFV